MISIQDLAQKILTVQRIVDSIEVHGVQNTGLVTKAYSLCDELLQGLQEVVDELQNESKEVGDGNGSENSGAS